MQTVSLYPESFFYSSSLDVSGEITPSIIRKNEKEEITVNKKGKRLDSRTGAKTKLYKLCTGKIKGNNKQVDVIFLASHSLFIPAVLSYQCKCVLSVLFPDLFFKTWDSFSLEK